ncbi:MAG: Gfo/Idh/MocA family oxidoreductase [Planctomycetes bacterium]|nr:Gfo/Idh/MocA family oxidoreductase [Planctomycetota bacterium]
MRNHADVPSPSSLTRRQFIQRCGSTAAIGAAAATVTRPRSARAAKAPGEPVVLGLIGCGRRGTQLLEAALSQPGIAFSVVCDVDALRAAAAVEASTRITGNRPAATGDYRDVLDDPQVEGVLIATPDHWHMIPFLAACAAGKDIYIEAPVAQFTNEAAAMKYAARKYKRVVQVGTQYRSARSLTEAGGIVRSGQLGRIPQVRTWTFAQQAPIARQPDGDPPPSLDYDRWLGPAPQQPYDPVRVQYPQHFWDYGGGEAMTWGFHLQDLMTAAMRVTVPRSIVAVGGNYGLDDFRETPDTLDATFEYDLPWGKFMHVYSVRLSNAYAGWGPAAVPPAGHEDLDDPTPVPTRSGMQVFGSEHTLYVGGQRLLMLPAGVESPIEDLKYLGIGDEPLEPATRPAPAASRVDPLTAVHVRQFADCIRSKKEPSATIEMAEVALFPCVAAGIAYRVGRKLYIQPESRQFFTDPVFKTPDDEANKLLYRLYRPPYTPPNV